MCKRSDFVNFSCLTGGVLCSYVGADLYSQPQSSCRKELLQHWPDSLCADYKLTFFQTRCKREIKRKRGNKSVLITRTHTLRHTTQKTVLCCFNGLDNWAPLLLVVHLSSQTWQWFRSSLYMPTSLSLTRLLPLSLYLSANLDASLPACQDQCFRLPFNKPSPTIQTMPQCSELLMIIFWPSSCYLTLISNMSLFSVKLLEGDVWWYANSFNNGAGNG